MLLTESRIYLKIEQESQERLKFHQDALLIHLWAVDCQQHDIYKPLMDNSDCFLSYAGYIL